jgi:hypothetical protein
MPTSVISTMWEHSKTYKVSIFLLVYSLFFQQIFTFISNGLFSGLPGLLAGLDKIHAVLGKARTYG